MDSLIIRLGLALAIGLLVGLERGWRERDAKEGERTAGIRTFGISGLLGGVLAALSLTQEGALVFAAGLVSFAISFTLFKMREAQQDEDFSVTTVIAGLCVFALGGLAVAGDHLAAAAGGAALAAALGSRDLLHGFLRQLSWVEVRSALVLSAMTVIVLPLLPDYALDPWGGFNPRQVWLLTTLCASISFAGYVASRVFGSTRGILVSGILGAIVSSTAVTSTFGQKARNGEAPLPLAGAACIAAGVSLLRVLVLVLALYPRLVPVILVPLLTGASAFVICGGALVGKNTHSEGDATAHRNPFELVPLLLFAVFFAVTSTLAAVLVAKIGNDSLVGISAASGLFDADVAVLTALRVGAPMPLQTVGAAVVAAVIANAGGRVIIGIGSGTPRYWLPLAAISLVAMGAAAASILLFADVVPGAGSK